MADFLDDFATDSDTEAPLPAQNVAHDRPWTAATADPDHTAGTAISDIDAELYPRPDYEFEAVVPPPPAAAPEPGEQTGGGPLISVLEAVLVTLDATAALRLLRERPGSCSAETQQVLLMLCDGDYGAVLESPAVRQLLGLREQVTRTTPSTAAAAEEFREQGNCAYKAGDYFQALEDYSAAIQGLSAAEGDGDKSPLVRCRLNRAACYLKTGYNVAAIADCNTVLDGSASSQLAQADNATTAAKALFRRGQAYKHVQVYPKAKADLLAAAKLAPKDSAIRAGDLETMHD